MRLQAEVQLLLPRKLFFLARDFGASLVRFGVLAAPRALFFTDTRASRRECR